MFPFKRSLPYSVKITFLQLNAFLEFAPISTLIFTLFIKSVINKYTKYQLKLHYTKKFSSTKKLIPNISKKDYLLKNHQLSKTPGNILSFYCFHFSNLNFKGVGRFFNSFLPFDESFSSLLKLSMFPFKRSLCYSIWIIFLYLVQSPLYSVFSIQYLFSRSYIFRQSGNLQLLLLVISICYRKKISLCLFQTILSTLISRNVQISGSQTTIAWQLYPYPSPTPLYLYAHVLPFSLFFWLFMYICSGIPRLTNRDLHKLEVI